jgi:hypothetical protein
LRRNVGEKESQSTETESQTETETEINRRLLLVKQYFTKKIYIIIYHKKPIDESKENQTSIKLSTKWTHLHNLT